MIQQPSNTPTRGRPRPGRGGVLIVAALGAALAAAPAHPPAAAAATVAPAAAPARPLAATPPPAVAPAAAADTLPHHPAATAFLPPDHWTLEALRRLFSLGLTPQDHDPSLLSLPRGEAAAILAHARREAAGRDPGLRRLVAGYARRFVQEFPASAAAGGLIAPGGRRGGGSPSGADPDRPSAPPVEGAAVAGGALARDQLLASGWSVAGDSTRGPVPREDLAAAVAGMDLAVRAGPSVALGIRGAGRLGDGPPREILEAAYATAHLGDLGLWAGRRVPGWGPGRGGRVLLDRRNPFDGAGLFFTEGVRLPWILEHLGPVRFETFAARLDRSGPIVEPWFWALRGSIAPHPRFRLAAAAATFFGGENNPVPTTLENILRMMTLELISARAEEGGQFTDGHAAVEAWWRPPLAALPLSLYMEWGFGDTSGGYIDVPAITAGARADALPGARWLSAGLEGSYFGPPRAGNGPTYRTGPFDDNWTRHGRLFGHPLGGTGSEGRIYATAHSPDARLRLRVDGFLRDRGRGNLLVPGRGGSSGGLEGRLELRRGSLELQLRGGVETSLEEGRDWTEAEASLRVRALFPGG